MKAKVNPYMYMQKLNLFLLFLSYIPKFRVDCSRLKGSCGCCYLNKTTSTLETSWGYFGFVQLQLDICFGIPMASYFDSSWTTAVAMHVLALFDNFVNMTSSTSIVKISLTPQQIVKKRQSSSEKKPQNSSTCLQLISNLMAN